MVLRKWNALPEDMQTPEVRKYYDILAKRPVSLIIKRLFDFAVSLILLIVLAIPMLVIALLITIDSPGGVFYRQVRVTTYGREFRIHKFRTMVANADRIGSSVTIEHDSRITRVGAFLRRYRLDELPQLLDVFCGVMSLVGTRPEIPKYVSQYTDEMRATLLLPAGITSEASIRYKDEAELLKQAFDADSVYVEKILPEKMEYNLRAIELFSFHGEIATMFRTILAVLGREYREIKTSV